MAQADGSVETDQFQTLLSQPSPVPALPRYGLTGRRSQALRRALDLRGQTASHAVADSSMPSQQSRLERRADVGEVQHESLDGLARKTVALG